MVDDDLIRKVFAIYPRNSGMTVYMVISKRTFD